MWLLSCVGQTPNLQANFLVKILITLGAGEWFFSCVGQIVFLQVIPSHIRLATFGARIFFVCLFTLVAGKCPLTCVGSCMGLQIALLCKFVVTLGTGIRLLTRM